MDSFDPADSATEDEAVADGLPSLLEMYEINGISQEEVSIWAETAPMDQKLSGKRQRTRSKKLKGNNPDVLLRLPLY